MCGISGVSRDLPCFPLAHHNLRTVSFASQYLASRVRATKVWTPKAFVDCFSSVGSWFLEKPLLHYRPQPFVIHRWNPLYSPWEHCVQYLRLTNTLLNASFSGFVFPQAWHTNVASASESCVHCLHFHDSMVCLRSKASSAVHCRKQEVPWHAQAAKHASHMEKTCKQAVPWHAQVPKTHLKIASHIQIPGHASTRNKCSVPSWLSA